jgi:preprotein translocase subunit SecF
MSALRRLYRGENDFNFVRAWKWGLRFSAALVLVSLVSLATRGLNLGIDFEGGVSWEVKAPGVTVDVARGVLTPLGLTEAKIQTIGTETLRVQAPASTVEKQGAVRAALGQMANVAPTEVAVSTVGPTWGGEITTSALRALVFFLIGILGYVTLTFRGQWKLAVGVVIAVLHDIIVSVGVYSVFQFEVTPATVIAFLTILGYSIYDTVVVYDKVQENSGRVGLTSRMTYTEMMNLSMNQVLLRSLNTSIVAVLPVLSTLVVGALILGAVTLEEFAIALTVGLTVGAYSSIFIAAPVVVEMKEREPRNRQLRERLAVTAARSGSAAPGAVTTATTSKKSSTATAHDTAAATAPPITGRNAAVTTDAASPRRTHPPRPRKQRRRR